MARLWLPVALALALGLALTLCVDRRGRGEPEAEGPRAEAQSSAAVARAPEPATLASRTPLEPGSSEARPAAEPRSSGALSVLVLDPAGTPLAGLEVSLRVSELDARAAPPLDSAERDTTERRAQTDHEGRARFEAPWCELRLVVGLHGQDFFVLRRRVRGRELAADDAPGSAALVLARGEEREVELTLGGRFVLAGVVLDESGAPVPQARVLVSSPDPGGPATSAATRANGRFELELLSEPPLARVCVRAEQQPSGNAFQPRPPERVAFAALDLTGRGGTGREELTLVLRPPARLTGRVLDARGEPVAATIHALPTPGPAACLEARSTSARKEGFELVGLPPGRYTLEARAPREVGTSARLEGVDAEARGIELRLGPPRLVRVTLDARVEDGSPARVTLLRATLEPESARALAAPELARTTRCVEPFGWPEHAIAMTSGGGSFTTRLGRTTFSVWPASAQTDTLELAPGHHWFGAQGVTADGEPLFPLGTGLVRVEEGDYHVLLQLVPATSLAGRLHGADPRAELCVALATSDGRLIALDDGRGRFAATSPLDAHGRFAFELAPIGAHELRFGTQTELLDGRAHLRQPLVLRRREPARIELGE